MAEQMIDAGIKIGQKIKASINAACPRSWAKCPIASNAQMAAAKTPGTARIDVIDAPSACNSGVRGALAMIFLPNVKDETRR